jgi:hypothetical protein
LGIPRHSPRKVMVAPWGGFIALAGWLCYIVWVWAVATSLARPAIVDAFVPAAEPA